MTGRNSGNSGMTFGCVKCSYELRGIAVDRLCPECGTPVMVSIGTGMALPTSGMAIASMICGIVSIPMLCMYGIGIVPGVVAIVLGELARSDVKKGRAGGASKGMAIAGCVCGWVGVGIAIAFFAVVLFTVWTP